MQKCVRLPQLGKPFIIDRCCILRRLGQQIGSDEPVDMTWSDIE